MSIREILPYSTDVINDEGDIESEADYGMGNQEWVNEKFMIDHIVDSPEETRLPGVGKSGLSVRLSDGAHAVKVAMDYYSYRNQTSGGKRADYGGRYSTPEKKRVAEGMNWKLRQREAEYKKAVSTLIGAKDMFDLGYAHHIVRDMREELEEHLEREYGRTGKEFRDKRKKVVSGSRKTAELLESREEKESLSIGANINDISLKLSARRK